VRHHLCYLEDAEGAQFGVIVNLTPAKQTGVTVPPNVLTRTDKVIK